MKTALLLAFVSLALNIHAQDLPIWLTPAEKLSLPMYLQQRDMVRGTNPPSVAVRTPAQFEEMQGVVIAWKNYTGSNLYLTLSQIVDHAKEVAHVYILCDDSNVVKDYLATQGIPYVNITPLQIPTNSIWARDYSHNNVYENEVSNLSFVEWVYNRPRPLDDGSPVEFASHLGVPIYETTLAPNRLVNTGGNFMCDGHGTAFASKLVLDDNGPDSDYNDAISEEQIDSIMKQYMGIKRYIKMETLPYDGIHHIDMHMKLLDEETLLVGQYPDGVSDGPQIEANIQYVTDNFQTCFNRPYKVVRIPQPPSTSGNYPGAAFGNGYYRNYCNALILNNIVLVPSYYEQYDTTALRIWKENMPGYKIFMIPASDIVQYGGTIHCITHEIGVSDPIWISHAKLLDTYQTTGTYQVDAYINTQSGVSSATLHWTVDTLAGYAAVPMTDLGGGDYQAMIPAQAPSTKVFYYIEASSNSGRTVRKPLVAPEGVIMFKVLEVTSAETVSTQSAMLFQPYPVPANDVLNVSFYFQHAATDVTLIVTDLTGRKFQTISIGALGNGIHNYQYDVSILPAGTYVLELRNHSGNNSVKKFSVIH